MTKQSQSDREKERLHNREVMSKTNPGMLEFIDEMKQAFPELRVYEIYCPLPRKDDAEG